MSEPNPKIAEIHLPKLNPWPDTEKKSLGVNIIRSRILFEDNFSRFDQVRRMENADRQAFNLIKMYQNEVKAHLADGRRYVTWHELAPIGSGHVLYYWIFLADKNQAKPGELVYIQPETELAGKPHGWKHQSFKNGMFEVVDLPGPQIVKCLRKGIMVSENFVIGDYDIELEDVPFLTPRATDIELVNDGEPTQ